MKKTEIEVSLKKLNDALNRLKECVGDAVDELDHDGVIQRFEFTFELPWKCLKTYLENEGITCRTPRERLKAVFGINLINDEAVFLDMLEDGNLSSHIYSRDEAERIYRRIGNFYQPRIETLLNKLKSAVEKK
ncbi:MAG: HI0074 family nucleotidyltransferase substrate-binding subunit [bacterium]